MIKKAKLAGAKIDGTFETVMPALRHGHHVRRSIWQHNVIMAKVNYDYRGRVGTSRLVIKDCAGNWTELSLDHDELFATDWELAPTDDTQPLKEVQA